jgi:CRP-like cAMP-binding protein
MMETRRHTGFGFAAEANHGANEMGLFAHKQWGASMFPLREVPPATSLFFQGSPAREVFCIEQGLIKLIRLGEDGQELIVGLRSKGDLPGAASLIVQELHPVTAITITSCSLRCIPAQLFIRLAKTDEQFCWYLHQVHSREVHLQASQLVALRCLSARQRFERLLLQFLSSISPHEKQAAMKIRLPLKHWEIAQLIGVTPEHLSRVLKQIKLEGILHEEAGHMIVPDVRKIQGQGD